MNRSKRAIVVVAALIVTALTGLTVLQGYLLKNAYEQRDQAFERNVWAALNSVTSRLEASEAASYTLDIVTNGTRRIDEERLVRHHNSADQDSLRALTVILNQADSAYSPMFMENQKLFFSLSNPQHVTIRMLDPVTGKEKVLVDSIRTAGTHEVDIQDLPGLMDMPYFTFQSDSLPTVFAFSPYDKGISPPNWISTSPKGQLVQRLVTNLVVGEFEPIEERLQRAELSSLLENSFKKSGIEIRAEYGVSTEGQDSLRLVSDAAYTQNLKQSKFSAQLFPNDFFSARNDLKVFFPERHVYIWKQMGPLLFLTILFVSLIALCFAYTIRVIVEQRRFAGRLVDFINNMTHEFKTPISTVLLACEALLRGDSVGDKTRLDRYGSMIKDESMRMRSQVEKILQMAVLEEGRSDLSLSTIHLHGLITRVATNFRLQAETRRGCVTLDLAASRDLVKADETHLSNVMNNILDNALKYSEETPEISVRTTLAGKQIRLSVSDAGIGLSKEDIQSVFDKYYRVSSGNVHNVKGFGLGLTYVKLIIEAHGGTVRIASELGHGTTVSIELPLVEDREI